MIASNGHPLTKQYIKNKPHKWGIKTFTRPGINGTMYASE